MPAPNNYKLFWIYIRLSLFNDEKIMTKSLIFSETSFEELSRNVIFMHTRLLFFISYMHSSINQN